MAWREAEWPGGRLEGGRLCFPTLPDAPQYVNQHEAGVTLYCAAAAVTT